MLVDKWLLSGLDDESGAQCRDQCPKPREEGLIVHDVKADQDDSQANRGEGVVDGFALNLQVQVPQDASSGHLPEPAQGEVKSELRTQENAPNGEGKGQQGVPCENEQSSVPEVLEDQDEQDGPHDVKLFFHSQGPQMQERVVPDVGVEVPFLVHEDLDVGGKDQWGIDSVETEDLQVVLDNFADDEQGETQYQDEDRVQSFDSAAVKVDEWELVLGDVFDDDLGDEEPGDDEEDVHTDESSWDCFWEGMVD